MPSRSKGANFAQKSNTAASRSLPLWSSSKPEKFTLSANSRLVAQMCWIFVVQGYRVRKRQSAVLCPHRIPECRRRYFTRRKGPPSGQIGLIPHTRPFQFENGTTFDVRGWLSTVCASNVAHASRARRFSGRCPITAIAVPKRLSNRLSWSLIGHSSQS